MQQWFSHPCKGYYDFDKRLKQTRCQTNEVVVVGWKKISYYFIKINNLVCNI